MPPEQRNAGIGPPDDVGLPLFVYGLLKPGELAHQRVVGSSLVQAKRALIEGAALRYRDGLPLLDANRNGGDVEGMVLWFDDAATAYAKVGDFEPRKHYKWSTSSVALEDDTSVDANILVGIRPSQGSAGETFHSWTSADDPVLAFGPQIVTDIGLEVAMDAFPIKPPESPELWERFFRLAGAYLLLWSLVERYTALAFGPAIEPWQRITLLDDASSFREAVRAGVEPGQRVVDSRDPSTKLSPR